MLKGNLKTSLSILLFYKIIYFFNSKKRDYICSHDNKKLHIYSLY